jgi:hypothetical protein
MGKDYDYQRAERKLAMPEPGPLSAHGRGDDKLPSSSSSGRQHISQLTTTMQQKAVAARSSLATRILQTWKPLVDPPDRDLGSIPQSISTSSKLNAATQTESPGKKPAILSRHIQLGPKLHEDPERIEFWRLLKWVDACREASQARRKRAYERSYNSHENNDDDTWLPDLHKNLQLSSRVVDVHRRRIIKAPRECQYIALSYVWGQKNFARLNSQMLHSVAEDGFLDNATLPRTIQDAIELCRRLGERYLWIDSLCIVQDTSDKHEIMRTMETIYRGALLTLVVAAGENADDGIPGFSRRFSSNSLGHFGSAVDDSIWNQRAWTYQERLLSQRMVIFTDHQIYFQCDHGRAQGDLNIDPHSGKHDCKQPLGADNLGNDDYRIQTVRKLNLLTYSRIVKEYTARSLTYASDIENAFGGVRKIMQLLFGGSEVLFGIPLSILSIGLLWYPEGRLKLRDEVVHPISSVIKLPTGDYERLPTQVAELETTPINWDEEFTWLKGREMIQQRPANPRLMPVDIFPSLEDLQRFPSWSWTGWVGPVQYGSDNKHLASQIINKLVWLDPLNRLSPLPAGDFSPPDPATLATNGWLRQVAPFNGEIYWTRRDGGQNHWYCYPIDPFIHNPIPIDRETGVLHLRTKMAVMNTQLARTSSEAVFDVLDEKKVRAGRIVMDGGVQEARDTGAIRLMLHSQTTIMQGEDDPAWSHSTRAYSAKPNYEAELLSDAARSIANDIFDIGEYNPKICWCLYNVLVVKKAEGASAMRRVGIGKIHVDAFDCVAMPPENLELV